MEERLAEEIREQIVHALAQAVKAPQLPATCVSLGLAEGTPEEAFRSKKSYVRERLRALQHEILLEVAKAVIERYEAPVLEATIDMVVLPVGRRISEITRRKAVKALEDLSPLFGAFATRSLKEELEVLAPDWSRVSSIHQRETTLADDIRQHYVRNDDWSNTDLLVECGALSCSQHRFIRLLERILHPLCHSGAEQEALAARLDEALRPDGYRILAVGEESGHSVYAIGEASQGVAGTPKNLIFASIGEKPDIVFADSVNNDIRIVRHADKCLVFDWPIPSEGLSWKLLASWWQQSMGLASLEEARKLLGERLRQSVLRVQSPGEYALFQQYYQVMGPKLGDRLPALLPQIYLHFDPLTIKQRGGRRELPRQRMDFLILLGGGTRIVVEVDGQQHYADQQIASPARYAEMIAEDRALRLRGYEVYRFGGAEFSDVRKNAEGRYDVGARTKAMLAGFFQGLFARHLPKK